MSNILILVLALCIDSFVACVAYGANQVKVTWQKVIILNCICSGCLGAALAVGGIIQDLVPEMLTRWICFISLFLMGLIKLLDYSIKQAIKRRCSMEKNIQFSISQVKILIHIYGDPMAADWDKSQNLSWKETVVLAFAMSIDNLVAGTLAAFLNVPIGLTVVFAFFIGIIIMYLGFFTGKKLLSQAKTDISWLSGGLFILLAFSKLIS